MHQRVGPDLGEIDRAHPGAPKSKAWSPGRLEFGVDPGEIDAVPARRAGMVEAEQEVGRGPGWTGKRVRSGTHPPRAADQRVGAAPALETVRAIEAAKKIRLCRQISGPTEISVARASARAISMSRTNSFQLESRILEPVREAPVEGLSDRRRPDSPSFLARDVGGSDGVDGGHPGRLCAFERELCR